MVHDFFISQYSLEYSLDEYHDDTELYSSFRTSIFAWALLPTSITLISVFGYTNVSHSRTARLMPQTNKDMLTVNSNASIEMQLRSRRKAAKMLVVVVIVFAVCYFPVHLMSILRYSYALFEQAIQFTLLMNQPFQRMD